MVGGEVAVEAGGGGGLVAVDAHARVRVACTVGAAELALGAHLLVVAGAVDTDTLLRFDDADVTEAARCVGFVAHDAHARVRVACAVGAAELALLAIEFRILAAALNARTGEGHARKTIAPRGRDGLAVDVPGTGREALAGGTPESAPFDVLRVVLAAALETRTHELGDKAVVAAVCWLLVALGVLVALRRVGVGRAVVVGDAVAVIVDAVAALDRARVDAPGALAELRIVAGFEAGGQLTTGLRIIRRKRIAVPGPTQIALHDALTGLEIGARLTVIAVELHEVGTERDIVGEAVSIEVSAHQARLVVVVDHLAALFGQVGATLSASGEGERVEKQDPQHQHGAGGHRELQGAFHGIFS